MEYLEYFGMAIVIGMFAYPLGYAYYKKLNHKLLFVFAVYGAESVVGFMLMGVSIPVFFLYIYVFPQINAVDGLVYLKWLLHFINFVANYWFLSTPFLLVVLPILLHRYYARIFDDTVLTRSANS